MWGWRRNQPVGRKYAGNLTTKLNLRHRVASKSIRSGFATRHAVDYSPPWTPAVPGFDSRMDGEQRRLAHWPG